MQKYKFTPFKSFKDDFIHRTDLENRKLIVRKIFWINIFVNFFLLFSLSLYSQEKEAFKIYNSDGSRSSYSDLIKSSARSDVIFLGELHNDALAHWLEYEVTKDLYAEKKENLILGAEMFESDDQIVIDEYLSGQLSENTFKSEAKLWQNFKTDYKPLLDFARMNKLRFIATNIPRRYASLVYTRGLEALDSLKKEAYNYIVPLPFEIDMNLSCYKDIMEKAEGHGGENLPKSQAIKDATMAYFINKNIGKNNIFIHYNGSYHTDNHEGICWYLKKYNQNYKILTISMVEEEDISIFNKEFLNIADYIIAIPTSFTKTY
jgi:uncharacterized iron-regulated protein